MSILSNPVMYDLVFSFQKLVVKNKALHVYIYTFLYHTVSERLQISQAFSTFFI
jgi:hypothetical protein